MGVNDRRGLLLVVPGGSGKSTLTAALVEITRALNPLGLEPLLLKGANALLPDAYPGAAEQVFGDLDLSVPPAREAAAVAAPRDLGYAPLPDELPPLLPGEARRAHHGLPLVHPTAPVKVELHRRLVYDVRDADRRRAFLEYLAQAEDWLGLAYPPGLPRAWSARRERWLQERVLTRAGWRRMFVLIDAAARLPRRLVRLLLTPGWLPWRLRVWRAVRAGGAPPRMR